MPSSRRDRRLELGAVAATNLLPLAGVTVLGWSLAVVVVLYWLELGVLLWWAVVRATFAQRPSNHPGDALVLGATRHKRGGLPVPRTDLSIPVQHLPVLAVVVPFLGLLWALAGAATAVALERTSAATALAAGEEGVSLAVGVAGIFASQGASTVSEYFLEGAYEEVNAQQALRSALWPIAVVGTATVVAGVTLGAGSSGLPLVVSLVCAKFFLDLAGAYRLGDRLRALDEETVLDLGVPDEPPEWDPVDAALSEPVQTVRPRRLGVVASGVVRGVANERFAVLVAVPLVATAGFLAAGADPAVRFFGTIAVASTAAFVAAGVLDSVVRHLCMEYRAGGDVVGYDRLLGEPQWRLPAWKVARADPERTVADRLLGTETLVVQDEGRTVRVVHVPDATLLDPEADGHGADGGDGST